MHHGADEETRTDEKDGECCKGPADREHHGALVLHLDRRAMTVTRKGKRMMSKRRTTAASDDGDECNISGR